MTRSRFRRVAALTAAVTVISTPLRADDQGSPIAVCSLLPKEEVKKHLPWQDFLDSMPLDEEPIGASGSSCGYPSVHVQVLPFSKSMLEAAAETAKLEKISGVGDEAYFRKNRDMFAELFVRVGARMLTLQADADEGEMESVKPRLVGLARRYVEALR